MCVGLCMALLQKIWKLQQFQVNPWAVKSYQSDAEAAIRKKPASNNFETQLQPHPWKLQASPVCARRQVLLVVSAVCWAFTFALGSRQDYKMSLKTKPNQNKTGGESKKLESSTKEVRLSSFAGDWRRDPRGNQFGALNSMEELLTWRGGAGREPRSPPASSSYSNSAFWFCTSGRDSEV